MEQGCQDRPPGGTHIIDEIKLDTFAGSQMTKRPKDDTESERGLIPERSTFDMTKLTE